MSHFSVLVLTNSCEGPDEALAPFNENLEVDRYIRMTREEALKSVNWYREDLIKKDPDKFQNMSDNAFLEYAFDGSVDKDFNILSTMNPNGKWDWYSIEKGRWGSSPIPRKAEFGGQGCLSCLVKEIAFEPNNDDYKEALEFWDKNVEHATDESELRCFYVACTRAKSTLYLLCPKKKVKNVLKYSYTESSDLSHFMPEDSFYDVLDLTCKRGENNDVYQPDDDPFGDVSLM